PLVTLVNDNVLYHTLSFLQHKEKKFGRPRQREGIFHKRDKRPRQRAKITPRRMRYKGVFDPSLGIVPMTPPRKRMFRFDATFLTQVHLRRLNTASATAIQDYH